MSNHFIDIAGIMPDHTLQKYHDPNQYWSGKHSAIWEADASANFKTEMRRFAKMHPDVMSITKHGNGANVYVGDIHIGSQGTSTAGFTKPSANAHMRFRYGQISCIEINTDLKLVIVNGGVAFSYDSKTP